MPKNISDEAQSLIKSLLSMKPEERIGAINIKELMAHDFFKGIEFDKINE